MPKLVSQNNFDFTLTVFVQVRGSYMDDIKGLAGIAGNKIEVPRYLLPDGSVGKDEAEFLNHYELTGNDECLFKSEVW